MTKRGAIESFRLRLRAAWAAVPIDQSHVWAALATAAVASIVALTIWTALFPRPTSRPAGEVVAELAEAAKLPSPAPTAESVAFSSPPSSASSLVEEICGASPQRALLDWIWAQGGLAIVESPEGLSVVVADAARWRASEPVLAPDDLDAGAVNIRGIRLLQSVNDAELQRCLASAPELHSLAAPADRLTIDSLLRLRQLSELRNLWMAGLSASREELEVLAELPAMERLYLDRATLRGDALQGLAGCGQLEELGLAGAKFPPDTLACLAALPQLARLDLRRTQVADDAVDVLSGFGPLRRLELAGSALSLGGLQRLRERLPACDVCIDDTPAEAANAFWPGVTLASAE